MRKLSVNRKPLRNCVSLAYPSDIGNAKRLACGRVALRATLGLRVSGSGFYASLDGHDCRAGIPLHLSVAGQ